MAEPITIGGQTFIKTEDGWIDKKTKVRAPEGLTTLLEKMNVDNTPQEKKKRVRIDTSRPIVKLGKSEYVWDLNGKTWIDKKTKDPVNPNFSKLIEATYQSIEEGVTPDDQLYKKQISDAASKSMGTAGQAAKQKVKKPTGKGQFAVPNVKINSPIVKMIEKLATIDTYLKQRLENQKMTAAKNIVAAKEQQIESTAAIDAQPVIDEEKIDAEVEAENKKANAAMIAFGIGAAGLIASQFDPVKEAFTGVVDFAKGVYGYLKDFISITNSGLETINSMGRSIGLGEKTSTPTSGSPASSNSGNDSASMQSPVATQVSNPQDSANPVQSSAPVATSNGDEIVVTAPRRSTSSSSSSSTSSDEIVVTAPRRSSSRSSSSSSSSSGSSDASRQSAPPPTSAAPVQTNSELSEAQNGTVWAGTDASGMKTFVRKINNKFETWTSTDGTHYDIDESQAQAQISSRGLRNVNTGSDQRQATGQQTIPQNNIVELGRYLQSQGLRISGHSQFGGQERGSHSANSRHYRDMAIDVNVGTGLREADDPTAGARFDKLATDLRAAGYSVIWRAKDHYDHLHVSVGGPESAGSSGEGADSDSSLISNIAKGGWEMTKGAIEAVSNIIRAGAGEYKTTTGSQLTSFDTEMVGKINAAAREKNAAMADAKTTEDVKKVSDPLNLNAKSGSPVVQNLASSADIDQVQKYLTRMGFPKIEYHIQTPKMNVA